MHNYKRNALIAAINDEDINDLGKTYYETTIEESQAQYKARLDHEPIYDFFLRGVFYFLIFCNFVYRIILKIIFGLSKYFVLKSHQIHEFFVRSTPLICFSNVDSIISMFIFGYSSLIKKNFRKFIILILSEIALVITLVISFKNANFSLSGKIMVDPNWAFSFATPDFKFQSDNSVLGLIFSGLSIFSLLGLIAFSFVSFRDSLISSLETRGHLYLPILNKMVALENDVVKRARTALNEKADKLVIYDDYFSAYKNFINIINPDYLSIDEVYEYALTLDENLSSKDKKLLHYFIYVLYKNGKHSFIVNLKKEFKLKLAKKKHIYHYCNLINKTDYSNRSLLTDYYSRNDMIKFNQLNSDSFIKLQFYDELNNLRMIKYKINDSYLLSLISLRVYNFIADHNVYNEELEKLNNEIRDINTLSMLVNNKDYYRNNSKAILSTIHEEQRNNVNKHIDELYLEFGNYFNEYKDLRKTYKTYYKFNLKPTNDKKLEKQRVIYLANDDERRVLKEKARFKTFIKKIGTWLKSCYYRIRRRHKLSKWYIAYGIDSNVYEASLWRTLKVDTEFGFFKRLKYWFRYKGRRYIDQNSYSKTLSKRDKLISKYGKTQVLFKDSLRKINIDNYSTYHLYAKIILLILFFVLPITLSTLLMFTNFDKDHLAYIAPFTWVGFDAIISLFDGNNPIYGAVGSNFGSLLGWNILYAVLTLFFSYTIGIMLSSFLNRLKINQRRFFNFIFALPVIIPSFIVYSIIAKMFSDDGFGLLANIFKVLTNIDLHFATDRTSGAIVTKIIIIAVSVWTNVSYFTLIMSPVLTNYDKHFKDIVRMDGNEFSFYAAKEKLKYIINNISKTLPILFVGAFNNFNVVYFLTAGGPLHYTSGAQAAIAPGYTDIFITYIYTLVTSDSYKYFNIAAFLGFILVTISMIASAIMFYKIDFVEENDQFM